MSKLADDNTGQITDNNGQPYPECLIIDRPDLRSMPLIFGERLVTILFWGFWLYLWLPFISLLAWWLGFKIFYLQMESLGGFQGLVKQFNVFASRISVTSGALAFWSLYNQKRYSSYDRRSSLLTTDLKQLATQFDTSMPKLSQIQHNKRVSFSFAEDDSIDKIDLSLSRLS